MSDTTSTSTPGPATPPTQSPAQIGRRTPAAARGEAAVWLTGGALAVSLALIVAVLAVIAWKGSSTFWPRAIERIELRQADGEAGAEPESFLGQSMERERYAVAEWEVAEIEAAFGSLDAAAEAGVLSFEGEIPKATRERFFVGGRDLGQEPTRWVPDWRVASRTQPEGVVLLERRAWGRFIGQVEGVVVIDEDGEEGLGVDGWRDRVDPAAAQFESNLARAQTLRDEAESVLNGKLPAIEVQLARADRRVRAATRAFEAAEQARAGDARAPWPAWAWGLSLAVAIGSAAGFVLTRTHRSGTLRLALACVCVVSGLAASLEHPWSLPGTTAEDVAAVEAEAEEDRVRLAAEKAEAEREINRLRAEADTFRAVVVVPATGRIAPFARENPDEPLRMSQVDRVVRPNELDFGGKVGVYLGRWWSYLSERPGEAPGDGGVYPVIIGTVTLTLLLTVGVVPLGVISAIYLREYAPQGVVTSAIRIAINNLAGVPSIVYGMFGLGFFCYTLGDYIDAGPALPAERAAWWPLLGAVALFVVMAFGLGSAARKRGTGRLAKFGSASAAMAWFGAIVLAGYLVATTPYFGGFFSTKLPEESTFGARGILWASLTLAILTLPVVIVATEEAIAAVPNSMRQGSYGCGASRWQTVQRIVLPGALPGIMTGTILAMARGAGEVAPLLLVGAVNLTKDLPVSDQFPFLHGDRSFMHLGFHIYNLGFQSPDSDATEPLVWTTTLLLIAIVLVLNLIAVVIRARLRGRGAGAAV